MFTDKISAHTQTVLAIVRQAIPKDTYLADGTAVVLYLNYRESYDIDFYSPRFQSAKISTPWQQSGAYSQVI